ncbi:MAG: hypothetical protein GY774_35690 [Planctomycetes bacterium]|nr:hypothetical protein [Planctomycetota bacterium]
MAEDLYCPGQKYITPNYHDGWYRIFKGYPKMSANVKTMIHEYLEKEQIGRILIFFTGHCGFDSDYSEFLLRELIDGKL